MNVQIGRNVVPPRLSELHNYYGAKKNFIKY